MPDIVFEFALVLEIPVVVLSGESVELLEDFVPPHVFGDHAFAVGMVLKFILEFAEPFRAGIALLEKSFPLVPVRLPTTGERSSSMRLLGTAGNSEYGSTVHSRSFRIVIAPGVGRSEYDRLPDDQSRG